MIITEQEHQTIHKARRMLRFLWLQGFEPRMDALEYDECYEIMKELDALAFRLTETKRPAMVGTRDVALIERVSDMLSPAALRADMERAHSHEDESVCGNCGGRAIDGRCTNRLCE